MSVKFQIKGLGNVRRGLTRSQRDAQRASASAVYKMGNDIIQEAQSRAPVDTGAMRASGTVSLPQTQGFRVWCAFGFGGPSKAYVVAQHENLTYAHPEGEAKFLENAMIQLAPEARRRLAKYFREAM